MTRRTEVRILDDAEVLEDDRDDPPQAEEGRAAHHEVVAEAHRVKVLPQALLQVTSAHQSQVRRLSVF